MTGGGRGGEAPAPRWERPIAALLVLSHAVLAWLGRVPGVTHSNDDSVYVLLAQAIRQFTYRDLYLVDTPFHTQYPPGWPAVLNGLGLLTGDSVTAAFVLVVLLTSIGLVAFYAGARRVLPPALALVALAASAWSIALLIPGGRLMSEASFFCATMVALWAASAPDPSRRRVALAMAAAFAAAYFRTVGLALLAALVVLWALERHWRRAALLAGITAIGFVPWIAWTILGPQKVIGRSYGTDLSAQIADAGSRGHAVLGMLALVKERLWQMFALDAHAVLPFVRVEGTPIDNLLWLAMLVVLGGGGLWYLWSRWRAVPLYLVASFGLLAAWTWTIRRFLFPLQPLFWVVLLAGVMVLHERFGRKVSAAAVALLLLGIVQQTIPDALRHAADGLDCDRSRQYEHEGCYTPEQLAFFAAARFTRDGVPPGDVVVVDREAAFAWHTGHRVVHSLTVGYSDARTAVEGLERYGARWVLIANLTAADRTQMPRYLLPVCDRFALVRDFGAGTVLFRLRAPGEGAEGAPSCARLAELTMLNGAEAVEIGVGGDGFR